MLKRNLILSTLFVLMIGFASTYEAYSQKPITGQIVSLNNILMGGNGTVTMDEATKLANNGNPIVFKSGNTIYFVYNEDGSFAGKRIAKHAGTAKVSITGKTKKVKGINIIIMSSITPM